MISKFVAACLLFFSTAVAASAACSDTNGAKGINLAQTDCVSWVDEAVLPPGQYYVALAFDFKLLAQPDSAATKNWLDSLKTLASGEQVEEVMLSVVPKLGNFSGIEMPVYRYVKDKGGSTYDTSGRYAFSTPFIRYDQKPLGFTVKLRAGEKVKYDLEKVIETVQPLLGAVSPANWLLSEAAKPVVGAVAGIGSKLLDTAYNYQDSDAAEFEMVEDTESGSIKRVITIKTAGDSGVPIGVLTVKVKFKRSIVAASKAVTEPENPSQSVLNYTEQTELLSFELPSVDLNRKTVVNGLSTENADMEALSTILFGDAPEQKLGDACDTVRSAATLKFGFNDVDTVRLLFELLERGGRTTALVQDSRDCFDRGDWALAKTFTIFDTDAGSAIVPDPVRVSYFATGLRRGMRQDVEYARQLSPLVEVDDRAGLLQPECTGSEIDKESLLDCLSAVKANRFEAESEYNGRRKTSLVLVTRDQVVAAIASEREERFRNNPDPQNRQDKELAVDKTFAARATDRIKDAIRITIWIAEDATVNRLQIERKSKDDIGREKLLRVGLSCWARNNGGDAPCVQSAIAYPG